MQCGSKHRPPIATLQPTTSQLPAIALREKTQRAWIRLAISAVSIKHSARSANILDCGLSAEVNFCVVPRDLHRPSSSPPQDSPLPSDGCLPSWKGHRLHEYPRGTARIFFGSSDFWRTKYTHVYLEQSSRTMRVYCFLPRDSTTSGLLNPPPPQLLICSCVRGLFDPLRRPFAREHPLYSSSMPSRTMPCCSAVLRSTASWECPAAQG